MIETNNRPFLMWEATATGPQPCWVISRLVEPGCDNPGWTYFVVNQATLEWRRFNYDPLTRQLGTNLYHDYQAARESSLRLARERLVEIGAVEPKKLNDERKRIDSAIKKMLRQE